MLNAERKKLDVCPSIQLRCIDYSLRAIELYKFLKAQRDEVANILGRQFLRSATSIGAHMIEAQAGESRADFIHKCSGAQKEARESQYWLQLMLRSGLIPAARLRDLIQETNEIVAIITAILVKTKKVSKQ